jgi:hypothetical protein
VVGVLVDAEVGHENHLVTDLVAQVLQRHLDDAIGVPRLGTDGVLLPGDPEEDDGRDAEIPQRRDLGAKAGPGVLNDAREGLHGLGFVNALTYEEGCDQIIDRQSRLSHEAAKGSRAAQTTGS